MPMIDDGDYDANEGNEEGAARRQWWAEEGDLQLGPEHYWVLLYCLLCKV